MVCCFSSYTNSQHIEEIFFNYAQERTWLTKVIRFFCSKQDDKKKTVAALSLAVWKWVIISYTLLCCTSDQKLFLKENSHKTHSKWSITNYLRQGVFAGCVWKLFKNREIIRANGETGRTQPKWEDPLVGWGDTTGL